MFFEVLINKWVINKQWFSAENNFSINPNFSLANLKIRNRTY